MSQFHHYLKIDSSLRVNPASTDPSDCFIPLHETLSGRYQLMSIQLPVTYFTLNSTNNQVIGMMDLIESVRWLTDIIHQWLL